MSNPTEEQVEAARHVEGERRDCDCDNCEPVSYCGWCGNEWPCIVNRLATRVAAAVEAAALTDNGKCGGCRDLGPHRDVPGCEYYREDAADVRSRLSLLLDHCTGARLSKSIYTVEVMIRAIEDHYARVASDQAEDEGAGEEIAAAWLADVQREAAEKAWTEGAHAQWRLGQTRRVSEIPANPYRRNEGENE